jgi:hypothetical protein
MKLKDLKEKCRTDANYAVVLPRDHGFEFVPELPTVGSRRMRRAELSYQRRLSRKKGKQNG